MAAAAPALQDADANKPPAGGRKRLLLMAIPLLLAGTLAGLWFTGILPRMLGLRPASRAAAAKASPVPVYLDLPDIVANLNGNLRHPSYIKLTARLQLASKQDAARVRQMMPRILDMFQTYLREMRPEELRGSAGTYRLREELLARANIAAAPSRITDVLFTQMLVQ